MRAVAERFEQKQAHQQIAVAHAAEIGQHADIAQPKGPVPPPQAGGAHGLLPGINRYLLRPVVQCVAAAAKYRTPDGEGLGNITARGKPLTLYHAEYLPKG